MTTTMPVSSRPSRLAGPTTTPDLMQARHTLREIP